MNELHLEAGQKTAVINNEVVVYETTRFYRNPRGPQLVCELRVTFPDGHEEIITEGAFWKRVHSRPRRKKGSLHND
jgi:hypothetical protein